MGHKIRFSAALRSATQVAALVVPWPSVALADAIAHNNIEVLALLGKLVELAPGYLSVLPKQDAALVTMLKARLLRYFDRFTHVDPILMERDGTWLLDMTTGD
jgi:hypothetical protein